MKKIKTIFLSSGKIAIPAFNWVEANLDLIAVVTSEDRIADRGHDLKPNDFKKYLLENNYDKKNIYSPKNVEELAELVRNISPELIIVFAYGKILSNFILRYPKYKCLNLHASLLPKHRGAIPIYKVLTERETTTGVTLQIMSSKLDAGKIIGSDSVIINEDDNYSSLREKIEKTSVEVLKKYVFSWIEGKINAVLQNETYATYCYEKEISKDKARIVFESDIVQLNYNIKAYYEWPVCWLEVPNGKFIGKRLKVFKARIFNFEKNDKFLIKKIGKCIILSLKNGNIEILEMQLEGKKKDISKNYFYLFD